MYRKQIQIIIGTRIYCILLSSVYINISFYFMNIVLHDFCNLFRWRGASWDISRNRTDFSFAWLTLKIRVFYFVHFIETNKNKSLSVLFSGYKNNVICSAPLPCRFTRNVKKKLWEQEFFSCRLYLIFVPSRYK